MQSVMHLNTVGVQAPLLLKNFSFSFSTKKSGHCSGQRESDPAESYPKNIVEKDRFCNNGIFEPLNIFIEKTEIFGCRTLFTELLLWCCISRRHCFQSPRLLYFILEEKNPSLINCTKPLVPQVKEREGVPILRFCFYTANPCEMNFVCGW